jgi:hypothetical protein
MPKQQPAAKQTGQGKWEFKGLKQIWGHVNPVSVDLALRLILAECVDVPGLKPLWDQDSERDKMLIQVGEPGVGKTKRLMKMGKRNNFEVMILEFAGTESEDNLPISTQAEDENNPGTYKKLGFGPLYRAPRSPDPNKPGKPFGICLVNEILGADPRQQQQARAFLSNRQLAGVKIHDGWILVADTNPLGAEYIDNKPMTRSLEARCFYIPVEGDYETSMNYWAGNSNDEHLVLPSQPREVPLTPGGFYEPLYMFLRMNGSEMWKAVDPRRWTNISDSLARQYASGLISFQEQMRFLEFLLPTEVVSAYTTMLQLGSDPYYYPITGKAYLEANPDEHTTHMARIKKWDKDADRNMLIGCTVWEVIGFVKGQGELKEVHKPNLKDLLLNVSDQYGCNILQGLGQKLGDVIWELIFDTPKEDRLKQLIIDAEAGVR